MIKMHSPQDLWLDRLQSATHYNKWIFSYIQLHLGGRTLEVGCGNGNFTSFSPSDDYSDDYVVGCS